MNIDFSGNKILVIGDIMLDEYVYGEVKRISPESPVPVVNMKTRTHVPGGAANVAHNIVALGGHCVLAGVTGNDSHRHLLEKILSGLSIELREVQTRRPTIVKTRIIGNHQQIVRIDYEESSPLDERDEEALIKTVSGDIGSYSAVILSDYMKGVCTPRVCNAVIKAAAEKGIPVIVDPKGSDWRKYAGASTVTPNTKELGDIIGREVKNGDAEVLEAGRAILGQYNIGSLLVTRSEKGMTLMRKDCQVHIPTEAIEVYDVSGAGDTVVAAVALCRASGYDDETAARIANRAAGIAVGKLGTAPVTIHELRHRMITDSSEKIIARDQVDLLIAHLKAMNKKIVFTNGCFDILHRGHVTYLRKAADMGDVLILGLNTDASVKRLKGEGRPVNNEDDRADVLSALTCIGYIVKFDEDTPYELIQSIRPDILVKGGDYRVEEVVGREFAGETVLIDFVDGYSTTGTIKKISK